MSACHFYPAETCPTGATDCRTQKYCPRQHAVIPEALTTEQEGYQVCEYWLPDRNQTRADAYTVKVNRPWDAEDVAEAAAEDFHSEHDGWEARWPIKIAVWFEDAEHIFEVEREHMPVFHAWAAT